jgi:LysM repeat protein
MKRLACALVLTGTLGILAARPPVALAQQTRSATGLQLSILTPDSSSIGDRLSLDVSFRGGVVDSVELYLDNALIAKRQLNTMQTRGIITFTLETLQLTEGDHNILVRAFSQDGKAVVATGRIRIPGADLSAPVRIAYPQNGVQISGVVTVRVQVAEDVQRQKPYVSFFVNKELKVLRNYPPYEYIWDTTKVPNGWHLLEAWTQTPDSLSPIKARPIHVNVNNASGETSRQEKVEDLRSQLKTRPLVLPTDTPRELANPKVDPAGARAGLGAVTPNLIARPTAGISGARRPTASPGDMRVAEPASLGYGATSAPTASNPAVVGSALSLPRPTPRMTGGAVVQPDSRIPLASVPRPALPGLSGAGSVTVVAPIRSTANSVIVHPGDTLESISRRTGVRAQDITRLNNLNANSPLKPGSSLIVPRMGAFDVVFNGTRIAFDVPPRIEGGVKLAPFRHIFEYTGGRLFWYGGEAQTVRAVNNTREIEIKIGNPNALVNNQPLTMERIPYIDRGRTIVPLSFIRDALDVKINFDPKSGNLLIESKK